jgi:hypothetical protein
MLAAKDVNLVGQNCRDLQEGCRARQGLLPPVELSFVTVAEISGASN